MESKIKEFDIARCERCMMWDEPVEYLVSSEIVHLKVCVRCAEEARELSLKVTPLSGAGVALDF